MILTLVLLGVLAFFIGRSIIRPLTPSGQEDLAAVVSDDEVQFRQMVHLREALVARLLGRTLPSAANAGTSPSSPESLEHVATLTDEQALEALLRVCTVLKRLGLPHLPTLRHLVLAGLCSSVLLWQGLMGAVAQGQPMEPTQDSAPSAGDNSDNAHGGSRTLPGLVQNADGTSMSQVNQFVLSPDQGRVRVFYLALIRSEKGEQVRLRIPSPDGATDFDFSGLQNATVEPDRPTEPPVLNLPLQSGVNQIQGVFMVPASWGTLQWRSSFFQQLPGVVLIIMPEYHDILSNLTQNGLNFLGWWPPRFAQTPADFELKRTLEQPNASDPNYARLKNPPNQFSYHLFRRADSNAPYPEFTVRGLVPSRTPGYLLIMTFGLILLGVLVVRMRAEGAVKSAGIS
jgi:hypothetical protein